MFNNFIKTGFCYAFRRYSATALNSDISQNFMIKNAGGTEFLKAVENVDNTVEKINFPKEAFNVLTKEYDELLEERSEFYDKYTRALAETENIRKRLEKQLDETKIYAVQNFCKDLLEVADTLNLALESFETNKKNTNTEEILKCIQEGVVMTKNMLLKTFYKHGLEQINPLKQKFDPNLHEAIYEIPKNQSNVNPGYVHQVIKVGYRLNNRPIRAAKVGVVKM